MRTSTVIIGAGHAGLAMSRRLTERNIDHVVLERGEVANSWRTQRWDSLRLLTPNWQTTLPGAVYPSDNPDGFAAAAEIAAFIASYREAIAAPVHPSTTVTAVRAGADGYDVVTDNGTWHTASVVIATGPGHVANIPASAMTLAPSVCVQTPLTYLRPDDLPEAPVLVVGGSATGVQLAEEIHRSGRPVTLSVGEHVRLPRTYRGKDVFWWMERAGILDERHDQIDDLTRARHLPSPQLIGTSERRTLDLNGLVGQGVKVVGRLGRIADGVAQFSGSLANTCALADLKLARLLDRFDAIADADGDDSGPPERPEPTRVPAAALELDLKGAGFGAVLFATGYRPEYPWLQLPVLDRRGHLRHTGGVVDNAPGLYALGLPVLRRRRSSYINGADADTIDIAHHLHSHLDEGRRTHPYP